MVRLVIIIVLEFFFFERSVLYSVSAIWSESEGDYSQSLEKIFNFYSFDRAAKRFK